MQKPEKEVGQVSMRNYNKMLLAALRLYCRMTTEKTAAVGKKAA